MILNFWSADILCLLPIYRAEELETALMEMVKQDNRRQLSARVSKKLNELVYVFWSIYTSVCFCKISIRIVKRMWCSVDIIVFQHEFFCEPSS